MTVRRLLAGMFLVPLLIAADDPSPELQRDGWKAFRAENVCSVIFEDAKNPGTFLVLYRAADGRNIVGYDGAKVPEGWSGGRIELISDRGEALIRRDFQNQPLPGIRVGVVVEDPEISAITRVGGIGLFEKKKRLVDQTFTAPPASWLSRCTREQKNVNHGSGKPAAKKAVLIAAISLTADDYPPRAQRNEAQGRAVASLTVSARGLVSGCTIAESSGNADLDEATCTVLSRQARFRPALDADGKPTESRYTQGITWTLPQD